MPFSRPPGVELQCDHYLTMHLRCPNTPTRAPRLVVCSKTPAEPGHKPLKMFTSLHYCELHKGELKLGDLLQPKVIRDFEEAARRKRPDGFKCDFDPYAPAQGADGGAFVEYVLTSTPEYRAFEEALGAGGMVKAALGVTRLAG